MGGGGGGARFVEMYVFSRESWPRSLYLESHTWSTQTLRALDLPRFRFLAD